MCNTIVSGGSQSYSGLSPSASLKCAVGCTVKVIRRPMRERTIEEKKHTYIHTYKYISRISIEHCL